MSNTNGQKFVAHMIYGLIAQAIAKVSSEGRDILQRVDKTAPARGRCWEKQITLSDVFVTSRAEIDREIMLTEQQGAPPYHKTLLHSLQLAGCKLQ